MSTRVDKGGPKFKPILKMKARPSATPAPYDVRTRLSTEPGTSMPPPASIPERTPSVAPTPILSPTLAVSSSSSVMQPGHSAPSLITPIQPSRPNTMVLQPSRPQGSGSAIPVTVARHPQLNNTHVHPSHATPVSVRPTEGPAAASDVSRRGRSPLPSTTVIGDPSRGASAFPGIDTSRGVPISVSRPSPATSIPIPSASSNGKKRAAQEMTETEGSNHDPSGSHPNADTSEQRGSVAQKRPKLSILQAEEDRVKRRPARRAKSKNIPTDTEIEGDGAGQATSEAEGQRHGKRPTKKKAVDENTEEGTTEEGSTQEKRKRRMRQMQDAEAGDTGEANDSPSTSSVPPRKRRRRVMNVEAAEPERTPEPIDPTQIRMSAICDDPGSGRISSRWESSQIQYADARKRAREERARTLAEADEEERETGRIGAKKAAPKPVLPGGGEAANAQGGSEESVVENTGQNPDEFTYTESLKASHYAPQVRIGANGEIVLDMDSLQVDRAADPELGEEPYSHVEESDQSKFTNNSSWSKRRVVRWGKEDTALFYDALRQFGQNFDLIARVLPGRTYRMCKNKFKSEDKKHSALIDEALRNSVAVDLGALSRLTGKDFSGPTPVIEAKKALNLGQNDAPGAADDTMPPNDDQPPAQKEICFSGADDGISVPGNVENPSSEQNIRRSASPPLPSTLLSSTATTRRSISPPAPETLLRTAVTVEPSTSSPQGDRAALPRPIPIATPARTPIAIQPPRPRVQAAVVKVNTASASKPPIEGGVQPSGALTRGRGKGKGKKNVVHEEDVEILGLVE